jgi:hypothetical protein
MVHSSTLDITNDEEHVMCGGFSLSETIHFGSLEFVIGGFGVLILSPRGGGGDLGAIFMGTTHSWSPSLQAMIEDSPN